MNAYEKLGVFYLGRVADRQSGALTQDYLLYDSRDLLTHAVCVGMTGSGKTGLCLALLEEAAIDGIPVIAIDPKGDLGNILLTFPDLSPEEFRPWVSEEEARRKGMTADDFARSEATRWRQGLAEWDQDGERIRLLLSSAETALYTPGSTAGIPLSILDSFTAPPPSLRTDLEPLRERASTLTAGLLGLLGIAADPIRSREHILIANILEQSWMSGKDLSLSSLIQAIQSPPMPRIGVFDLESFFPASDRLQLAMMMNNLLAAPGFASWMEGASLNIGDILHTPQGRPRISVFSIAHLSDNERMFFVTLLFNQVLGWARAQSGTASLRAVLYMDEIFGFLPPVEEPPSKRPLLTLLKQARAFGLGIVLATQNPIDLDYKALSNAGTWFIGRLQTERDRDRLLDGLAGRLGSGQAQPDAQDTSQILSSLKSRTFLMHNVHEEQPVLFGTRWTLSYLAGPLTRAQIRLLSGERQAGPVPVPAATVPQPAPPEMTQASAVKPSVPPGLRELFASPVRPPLPGSQVVHRPFLFASARIRIVNNKYGITSSEETRHILGLEPNLIQAPWDQATELTAGMAEPASQAHSPGLFSALPTRLLQQRSLDGAMKGYLDWLYRRFQIILWKSEIFRLVSRPGESERDFRVRLQQTAREKRDFEVDKLRQKYAARIDTLRRQLQRASERQAREQEQYNEQKTSTAIAVGSTLLSALFGRKTLSVGTLGRAGTAARQASRISRERQDVQRADDEIRLVQQQIEEVERQLRQASDEISRICDPMTETLQEIVIRPAKADFLLQSFGILWVPFACSESAPPEQLYP